MGGEAQLSERKRFVLIGPGKVGIAFAYLLQEKGYILHSVIGKSSLSLEQARLYLGQEVRYFQGLAKDICDADFLLLGVQDDQLSALVGNLWAMGLIKPGQVLVHFSGVHPAAIGQSSEMMGINRLSLHPMQSIPSIELGIESLCQAIWSIEGDIFGLALGEELLTDLRVTWVPISTKDKPLYHAAACIAANYLVTLTQTAIELLNELGFSSELAQKALLPLIQGTVTNLKKLSPEAALTGPLARGDGETIKKHLIALKKVDPEWLALYQILAEATLKYANLSEKKCAHLKQILRGGMKDETGYTIQVKRDEE